jgi:hypothetical protein
LVIATRALRADFTPMKTTNAKTNLQTQVEAAARAGTSLIVSGWSRKFEQAQRLQARGIVNIRPHGEKRGRAMFAVSLAPDDGTNVLVSGYDGKTVRMSEVNAHE